MMNEGPEGRYTAEKQVTAGGGKTEETIQEER